MRETHNKIKNNYDNMTSFLSKVLPSSQGLITKRHTVKRILSIPPQHLYNIIIDVNSYSKFLPFCKSSHIIRSSPCNTMFDASLKIGFGNNGSNNNNQIYQEEYISRVTKKIYYSNHDTDDDTDDDNDKSLPLEWIVTAKSIKSTLFHNLNSSWKLTPVKNVNKNNRNSNSNNDIPNLINECDNGNNNTNANNNNFQTNVEFEVEINVSNPIISIALDSSLEQVANQQVAAFERRCMEIPFVLEQ